jgi:SAM-dependent methyltransferase
MTRAAWHTDQYAEPKRSTLALRAFTVRTLGATARRPLLALDAGCGAGANMAHLAAALPEAHWTGVDLDPENVAAGRRQLPAERFTVERGDIHRLAETYGPKRFDVCFSIMVLSWIEDYERALSEMLTVTKGWVFLLNLFAQTDVDAFVNIVGRHAGPQQGYDEHYNVYSLPRFEAFAREHGARELIAEPFDIDVDLPKPDAARGMGTWTERLESGRRLQFSGPLWMPWWLVALRLE